jgi:hypothetical protein
MSEPQAAGTPDHLAHNVFPTDAEASDDAPTIISKPSSARGPAANGSVEANPAMPGRGEASLRGRTLAHFELIEPIGVGGMAAVIRARDRQLDRLVALKILPPEMATDPENVRRFHQEARAAARLDHENIARVFYCGEDQRLHFIAFEFVEGINLRALLERRGRLPVAEAVHYMLQIAAGLAHAAGRGVVHRDIKPSNIIISPNGRAKLVDMGLARNLGPADDKGLTQSGVTLGTFDYIAPEQAMDPREADVRSDVYALGCTFYHMLTGQPPVPEGTAAKKLHHHQHIPPVDPRQLNPDIPDDVAAILNRMMAKDPRDRYQRAEHLVQHLIQVAQKLGATADVPDGVLFVDAPLPAPPRKRPFLMAAVGALALGVFLVALSFAPPRNGGQRPPEHAQAPGTDKQPPAQDQASRKDTPQKVPPPPQIEGQHLVTSEHEFRQALASPATHLRLTLAEEVRIREGGLTFRAKGDGKDERTLIIVPANSDRPARLVIQPPKGADHNPQMPWGGLELGTGTVEFRDLHFEIQADTTPSALLAAVLVKGARSVLFTRCVFTQARVPIMPLIEQRRLAPLASVAAWNPGRFAREKPRLRFEACYFRKGQAAVTVHGSADVYQAHCAFGPHASLFHLLGEQNPELGTHFHLDNLSAFLVHGPAFRLDSDVTCELKIQHSIFSCPDKAVDPQPDATALIYQTDTGQVRSVRRFQGQRNCYHNLPLFWARPKAAEDKRIDLWDGFRAALAELEKPGHDESSTLLTAGTPWASPAPLDLLDTNPRQAFHINPTLTAVRQADLKGAIGVGQCAWGVMYAKALPELSGGERTPVAKRKPNEKVVDPKADGNTPNVYRTVLAALAEAEDRDVILIKHNGLVPVSPVTLKVGLRVTLRPDNGYRPVLTLAPKTVETEPALFTLYEGELVLENLEFRLRPDREDFKAQAVVALGGNGQVGFKQCVVTLDLPQDSAASLSAITLFETRDTTKAAMGGSRTAPDIHLQQCFVRGEGDLLFVRPSRALKLEVDGSLVALSGSLVHVEGGLKEVPAGGAVASVKLKRTTTYLGDHLLQVRPAMTGKGAAFTDVHAQDCLMVAAGGRPLVFLDGPGSEEQARRVFTWRGERNSYAGYEVVLEQQPAGEGAMPQRFKQDDWKRLTSETDQDPQFLEGHFDVAPLAERPLSQAVPGGFRFQPDPKVEVQGGGANPEQLPRPAAVGKVPVMPAAPAHPLPAEDGPDAGENE